MSRRQFGWALAVGAIGTAAYAQTPDSSWVKLPTVPYPGKQDDIFFVDASTGWYGNGQGKLYRTQDGGDTWEKQWEHPGTYIRALGFLDHNKGFLGNIGKNYFPGVRDSVPLYRTYDAGKTWIPVMAPGVEAVPGVCAIHILPVRRIFDGAMRVAHVIHAAGRVGGPAMILRSEDDGESWRVIDLSAQAGMILDVCFHSPRIGFVAAATKSESGDNAALILATSNGGQSWHEVYRSRRTPENVWKMSWPSRQVGFATIQNQNDDPAYVQQRVIRTRNGGRSWQELPLVADKAATELGIGFVDERRGWVGTRTGAYETCDGGDHWAPAPIGRMINKFRIIRGADATRVFAIGVELHKLELSASLFASYQSGSQ